MGSKKTEKKEAILTIIELCQDLSQEEEERLGGANVEVSRPERGRKGTIELKLMLNDADSLMRKVWSQLEIPCREEGVKRFMVEASTQMSPAKQKQKTSLQKARDRVGEHLKKEEQRNKKAEEEKRSTKESSREEEETLPDNGHQVPPVLELHEGASAHKEVESLALPTAAEQAHADAPGAQNPASEEAGLVEENVENTEGKPQTREKANLYEGSSNDLAAVVTRKDTDMMKQGDALSLMKAAQQKQGEDKTVGHPQAEEDQDIVRVKAQKWLPPTGKRRCS